jgi:hypothetical protein
MAVLNGGDVVAQYHYFCLTALYNKERAYLLTIENQDDSELSQEREHLSSCFVMACQSSNVEFSFSHKNTYDLQC